MSPAKALNVITVGNYDDDQSTMIGNAYVIDSTSAYKDPFGGYSKPEISAPGTNIEYNDRYLEEMGNNAPRTEDPDNYLEVDGIWYEKKEYKVLDTGTSFATPFAAAFAANAMSNNRDLELGGAALMKAHLIASATNPVVGDKGIDGLTNPVSYAGEGGIDYESSHGALFNRSVKSNNRADIFKNIGGGWQCNKESTFTPVKGKRYNAAISWISSGDYTLSHQKSELDLNLYITDNNNWYYINDTLSSYEKVDFTAQTNGLHTVYICKMRDDEPTTPINFGLSIVEYK